ncbi:unnamed protein product [Vitrella brassicaformis CCMP3155]|uniref:Major facilitator superfamily (MFS) profile domain-containing protein n=1 Tax=Vitrella brassicaformis (strain CCMP3155) TaxID=1169540 RepID=A0A0G4GDZ4_VITBC|nr:unnamed protein product [Vitrella brassicaformis CCMP3155]|eukprot:CEM27545.1 unnamed protein product [Vitrella brassicaformis CCMP3155]
MESTFVELLSATWKEKFYENVLSIDIWVSIVAILPGAVCGYLSHAERLGRRHVLMYLCLAASIPWLILVVFESVNGFYWASLVVGIFGGRRIALTIPVISAWITEWAPDSHKTQLFALAFSSVGIANVAGNVLSHLHIKYLGISPATILRIGLALETLRLFVLLGFPERPKCRWMTNNSSSNGGDRENSSAGALPPYKLTIGPDDEVIIRGVSADKSVGRARSSHDHDQEEIHKIVSRPTVSNVLASAGGWEEGKGGRLAFILRSQFRDISVAFKTLFLDYRLELLISVLIYGINTSTGQSFLPFLKMHLGLTASELSFIATIRSFSTLSLQVVLLPIALGRGVDPLTMLLVSTLCTTVALSCYSRATTISGIYTGLAFAGFQWMTFPLLQGLVAKCKVHSVDDVTRSKSTACPSTNRTAESDDNNIASPPPEMDQGSILGGFAGVCTLAKSVIPLLTSVLFSHYRSLPPPFAFAQVGFMALTFLMGIVVLLVMVLIVKKSRQRGLPMYKKPV